MNKKLIFVFILLLILPFTGCKSVVKETDVEKPVRIVSPNGDVYVGEWKEGKPWNITIYGKSGIIIMKYVNGVEQK